MLGHSLNTEMPPNRRLSLNPKMKFERERDKQIQVISRKHNNNKHAGHKDLSRGSATPQRSSYVLIVEVTTKVRVSSTFLPLSKWPQRSLELSTKKSKGNTNFPRLFPSPKSNRRKSNRLDEEIKCSSLPKWFSHLIHSPFTQTLRESKIRAKEEGEGCFSCLGAIQHEVSQLWNESVTVRSEQRKWKFNRSDLCRESRRRSRDFRR